VKFEDFKDQKKELTPLLAEKSRSHLVTRVGNVVVLYRPKSDAKPQAGCESPQSLAKQVKHVAPPVSLLR
jgi:RNA-binding protein YhbY